MTLAATQPVRETQTTTISDAIEQTLEWLDQQANEPNSYDRRNTRRGRYRVAARVSYLPAGGDRERTYEVSTRNLSRTGLSFIHKSLIYPRQKVGVELPLPDHSVRMFRGNVVRVRPAGVGLYEIGVEFTELQVVMGVSGQG